MSKENEKEMKEKLEQNYKQMIGIHKKMLYRIVITGLLLIASILTIMCGCKYNLTFVIILGSIASGVLIAVMPRLVVMFKKLCKLIKLYKMTLTISNNINKE